MSSDKISKSNSSELATTRSQKSSKSKEKSEASRGSSSKQNMSTKLEIVEKLKILCLHGYRQNGDSFKSKLGSFRKYSGKYADFVFATAPHMVVSAGTTDDLDDKNVSEERSWWFNSDDEINFKGTNRHLCAFKFQESLRYIEKIWLDEGPFQGLLGFSQGACFVGLLCGIAKRNMCQIKPKFAIMSSGFLSGSLVHMRWYEEKIQIPTLHIFGESDEIIPSEMSEKLAAVFEEPEIIKHSGGHYFPATSAQKQAYVNFFQDRLQEYLENKELERIKNEGLLLIEDEIENGSKKNSNSEDSDTDYDFDHPKQCMKHRKIEIND